MNDDTISRQENDTIYRQDAIDKFEPWLKVKGYNEGELNMLKAVLYELKFLPSAQPEPRWIPVTERLPEDTQNIIVTRSDDGTTDFGQYNADKNWCVNDGYWPNAFDFIAWMPLPEPYKDGEHDE